ncbi:MAG TPA: murein biosynthesis integral membrane protein MurJ [Dermatophilaceae bacterium]|nr:murein biosynthesis integral membrane protein MurJ [Dermatophilaceae bacterium]
MSESVSDLPPDSPSASLARSTAGMAAGIIASRILGVVRAAMQLAVVGTALAGDAWDVANTLPNIIYLLLAGGVLNAVLVPQITRADSHADGGREYVDRLLTIAVAGVAVVAVVFTLAAGLLVELYSTQSWTADVRSLSIAFALICMPQVFFYGLYTLLGQVLNARNHFAAYMWAPAMANVVAIAGMAYFLVKYPHQADVTSWTSPMVWVLAGSATAGVAAQALVLVVPLWRSGFRYRPRWGVRGVGLRTASTVALWTFAATAVSAAGFIITSRVLTYAGQAGVSAGLEVPGKISYTNALLIFMLPHGLVTVSLVTALFTRMSRAAHAGDLGEVRADVDRGMRLTAVATVPATVGAFVLGFAATATLYQGSSESSTRGIAMVMMAMMVGLVPFGVFYLLQRVFYAFEDARTPFRLQLVVTAVATIANLASLLLPLRWIAVGVGAGLAISNLAGMAVGLVLARRRLEALPLREVSRTYVRLGVASVVAAAAAYLVQLGVGHVLAGKLYDPVALVTGGLVFVVIYVAAARALRVREIDELVGPVLERVRQTVSRSPRR